MMMKDKQLGLIGFMGTGKTTVGEILAKLLDWKFLDTDLVIECSTGKKIAKIFSDDGEDAFREIEQQVVREVSTETEAVISFGGGVPLDAGNRSVLRDFSKIVLLRASPAVIVERTSQSMNRPLLDVGEGLLYQRVSSLLKEREPHYFQVADFSIDTDGLTVHQVADTILGELNK